MMLCYVGAALAVLAWGTFTVPMKSKAVAQANLDPFVFQFYMGIGIGIASALMLLLPDLRCATQLPAAAAARRPPTGLRARAATPYARATTPR